MHCWLARRCEGHIAGGFLGDFVKGRIPNTLPEDLQQGIRLHRYIDRISNQIPEMRETYWRFGTSLRRVAPILLDLLADHLLAKQWERHGQGDLEQFTARCYTTIGKYPMSDEAQRVYQYVKKVDLWKTYDDFGTMVTVMHRILRRLKFTDRAPELANIKPKLDDFYQDFLKYYPILIHKTDQWLQQHSNGLISTIETIPTPIVQ